MKWVQMLTEAIEISRNSPPPVILVIHTGGNDLCFMRVSELLTLMRADVDRAIGYFAEVVIVWSEMVPRVRWQGARDAGAIERARRTVNARMARFIASASPAVRR